VGTSSAEPAKLLAFEQTTRDALAPLYDPALTLMEKLQAVRADPDAQRFLPQVPYIGGDVLDLYAIGRHLAGWVGDVGRAFGAADTDGDGRVDDSQLQSVERLGNGTFTVMEVNGRIVIDTGDGDDEVTVVAVDGGIRVTVNGVEQVFTGVTAASVILRLGGGDDVIEVGTDVDVRFTLEGQTGDDRLEGGAGDETIRGGDGRDYIDGFSGDDDIEGGEGHDVVYAGDGDDVVRGGDGRDYLDGGEGADTVLGGDLADIVAGGDGADTLDGEGGDDVVYAGGGDDRVVDHGGDNTVYAQADDDVDPVMGESSSSVITIDLSGLPGDSALRIEGSPRFQQRMLADLETLRSSPTGREMLLALDDIHEDTKAVAADWPVLGRVAYQGDTVVLREYEGTDNSSAGYDSAPFDLWRWNEIRQSRGIVEMYPGSYTPSDTTIAWQQTPPVVVLFHEMAHQYDYGYGTTIDGTTPEPGGDANTRERQAVGLPVDHDGDDATPPIVDPDHPITYTENGLRREMGLPDRETYLRP
jgi:Effector protein/RTX calcium-binding nonapeptide repeat (4 copies)